MKEGKWKYSNTSHSSGVLVYFQLKLIHICNWYYTIPGEDSFIGCPVFYLLLHRSIVTINKGAECWDTVVVGIVKLIQADRILL